MEEGETLTLGRVRELLEAEFVDTGRQDQSVEQLRIRCCGASDLISDLLSFSGVKPLLLTGLTNAQVIRTADLLDFVAICFVRASTT